MIRLLTAGSSRALTTLCLESSEGKLDRLQKVVRETIESNQPEILRSALKEGASVNRQDLGDPLKDYHIVRATYCSGIKSYAKIIEILLKAQADPNLTCEHGHSPIMIGASRRNLAAQKLLIDAGANVNHQDLEGETALIEATKVHDAEMVELLLKAGASARLCNKELETPLIAGSRAYAENPLRGFFGNRFFPIFFRLMQESDVNAADHRGTTALMLAAEQGGVEMVTALLAADADRGLVNKEGKTAFAIALEKKLELEEKCRSYDTILELLVEAEGRSYAPIAPSSSAHDETDLYGAVFSNDPKRLEALLQEGADPNALCYNTALLNLAARRGFLEIVTILLKAQANPHTKDRLGDTALLRTRLALAEAKGAIKNYEKALSFLQAPA